MTRPARRARPGRRCGRRWSTYGAAGCERRCDLVAAEEPLEMRVSVEEGGRRERHSVAVTMRTPGHDFPLAAGFFFTEGIVAGREAIAVDHLLPGGGRHRRAQRRRRQPAAGRRLRPGPLQPQRLHLFELRRLRQDLDRPGAHGLPGAAGGPPADRPGRCSPACRRPCGGRSRCSRAPAACTRRGCSTPTGGLLLQHEDVGRHNAVDKVVGTLLLDGALPASDRVLLVSGRASFELVQKALAAGIPLLAAVGAPSSLAVELAREFGLTLVGFLRDGRFNVYSGEERIPRLTREGRGGPARAGPGPSRIREARRSVLGTTRRGTWRSRSPIRLARTDRDLRPPVARGLHLAGEDLAQGPAHLPAGGRVSDPATHEQPTPRPSRSRQVAGVFPAGHPDHRRRHRRQHGHLLGRSFGAAAPAAAARPRPPRAAV